MAVIKKENHEGRTEEIGSSSSADNVHYEENFVLEDDDTIRFAEGSELDPRNWSTNKKLYYTLVFAFATFSCQFNSSTMASESTVERFRLLFGVGREFTTLGTTLYVLGIAFGPMIFAPLSEMYGRKSGVFVPFLISALFTLAGSVSYDTAGVMVTRFFSGFFAGAPIVSTGGVLADIWSPSTRGSAIAFYAMVVSLGPCLAPIISSLLVNSTSSYQSWRYALWVLGLFQLVVFAIGFTTLNETYAPVILSQYAKKYRLQTGNWVVHSKQDEWHLDWKETVSIHLVRPFAMLATPIVFLMVIYASYVFGLFYLILTNVSVAFHMTRGWTNTVVELPLLAFLLGNLSGCFTNMLWARRYKGIMDRNNGIPVPEQRLVMMMMLSWCLPAGIFIFGWTCRASIPWIAPCIGLTTMAIGYICIFQNVLNYLVDSFPRYSASAIAANTFMRSVFASIFPLFGRQLFTNVGVSWGASIIGFIGLGMLPIPFVFFKYGKRIRAKKPVREAGVVIGTGEVKSLWPRFLP